MPLSLALSILKWPGGSASPGRQGWGDGVLLYSKILPTVVVTLSSF
jgi:hypothetical protein